MCEADANDAQKSARAARALVACTADSFSGADSCQDYLRMAHASQLRLSQGELEAGVNSKIVRRSNCCAGFLRHDLSQVVFAETAERFGSPTNSGEPALVRHSKTFNRIQLHTMCLWLANLWKQASVMFSFWCYAYFRTTSPRPGLRALCRAAR